MAENEIVTGVQVTEQTASEQTERKDTEDNSTELSKLRAQMAKQKEALDKATKEAADFKKQLRAKQSAEEVAAEEKRISDEARDKELSELRKRFAVAETSKKVMTFVGDEAVANQIAEYIYGADDADAAVDAIQKAWVAREKKLRVEYGKIPAPGTGSTDGPTITRSELDAMSYLERLDYAKKHPTEYDKLLGRTK